MSDPYRYQQVHKLETAFKYLEATTLTFSTKRALAQYLVQTLGRFTAYKTVTLRLKTIVDLNNELISFDGDAIVCYCSIEQQDSVDALTGLKSLLNYVRVQTSNPCERSHELMSPWETITTKTMVIRKRGVHKRRTRRREKYQSEYQSCRPEAENFILKKEKEWHIKKYRVFVLIMFLLVNVC